MNTKDFAFMEKGKKSRGKKVERQEDVKSFMVSYVDFFVTSCSKFVVRSQASTTWVNYGLRRPPLEMKSRLHCRLELSSNIA